MNRPTTILMTVLLTCACAWAQQDAPPATTDQPAAPTTQPAAGVEQLTVTVVSVEGKVYYRDASVEGGERKPLQAGDTLTERMVVITGFGSKAVRASLVRTDSWRSAAPNSVGSTSKSPPAMTRPRMVSR